MLPNCNNCQYNICGRIPAIEPLPNTLAIIGMAPGNEELKQGKPFVGRSGSLLRETLIKAQLPTPIITNALLCKPIDEKKVDKKAILNCRGRLIAEIKQIKPKLIITLGNIALQALQNDFKLKIGQVISTPLQWVEDESITVLPNYHPAKILRNPGDYKTFQNCFLYAKQLLDGESKKDPGETHYIIIENEEQAKAVTEFLINLNPSDVISCDIETTSLKISKAVILCVGFSFAKNKSIIFTPEFLPYVKYILEHSRAKFVYHKSQYDTGVMQWQGINANVDHDTILLHYAINENVGRHDLKLLSRLFLGAGHYEDVVVDKANMQALPKETLAKYCSQDCDYTLQLFNLFHSEVVNNSYTNLLYNQILIPGVNFLRRVTQTGFMIDQSYLEQYKVKLDSEIKHIKVKIATDFGHLYDRDTYMRESGAKSAPKELNIGSHKQLGWLIYDKLHLHPTIHTKVVKSTDKDVLGSIYDDHPIVPELLKYSEKIKLMNTYVEGIEENVDEDGRLRSTFNLQTTVTGRLSSSDPNLQNIPRTPEIKKIFKAKEGSILLEADYSQLEVRVLAYVSQDKFLIDLYNNNKDIHNTIAKKIYGENFTDENRTNVKSVNFRIVYGGTAFSIHQEFGMSLREAQMIIDEWFDAAKEAKIYLDNCIETLKNNGIFTTPMGRSRRFGVISADKEQQNECKNFTIQSIASDLTLLSAMKLEDLIAPYNAKIINLVHDSIIIELDNDKNKVENVCNLVYNIMKETPKKYLNTAIPFKCEIKYGYNWGEMIKFEKMFSM
jgi:DNA polymerase-1